MAGLRGHVMGQHEHLLLYDGVCGLCNRLVQLVLAHDTRGTFDFAALQSAAARAALGRFGRTPDDLNTVYVVAGYRTASPQLLSRGRAAVFVVARLGLPWSMLRAMGILPRPVLDWGYDLVARQRYRVFGRYDACPLPDPSVRDRFIDATAAVDAGSPVRRP